MIFSFCILKSAACPKCFIPMGNNFKVDITISHSKYSCLQTIKTLIILATKKTLIIIATTKKTLIIIAITKNKLKWCVRVYSHKIAGAVEA